MWHSGDGMGWWVVLGSVWFVIFWAAVLYVIFHVSNRGEGSSMCETPQRELS